MDTNDDEPAGAAEGREGDAADALAPPERAAGLRRNPIMMAVIAVVVVAVVAFLLIAALS